MPEVVVVGGSLAGAAAALELARLGRHVLLVEKATLPRRNPCGEGLSSLGVSLIDRLGLAAQIAAKPHFPFNHFAFISKGKRLVLPLRHGYGLGIERSVLDEIFFDALSLEPTVETRYGVAVTGISEDDAGCTVSLKGGDTRGSSDLAPSGVGSRGAGGPEVRCRFVILACGAGNSLLPANHRSDSRTTSHRTSAGRIFKPNHTSYRYGLSQTLAGRFTKDVVGVTVFLKGASALGSSEIYCTRVSPSRLNISLLADRDYFQNHRRALVDVETICRDLSFSGEVVLPPQGSGPFTKVSYRASPMTSRILPIGDAYQVLDPAGGMGMTHALLSAALASRTVSDILNNPKEASKLIAKYRRHQLLNALPLATFTKAVRLGSRLITRWGLPFDSQQLPLADWSERVLRIGGRAVVPGGAFRKRLLY